MSDGLADGEEREAELAGRSGNPVWDDWDNPPWVPEMPVLHLDGFDGPMDLLLDLAERQRIDFGRMSVRDLAEQFVAAMERLAGRVSLERRADWLVLATRLRRSARVEFEFWAADWTPWVAIQVVRRRWPALVFDIRPDYGGE